MYDANSLPVFGASSPLRGVKHPRPPEQSPLEACWMIEVQDPTALQNAIAAAEFLN